MKANLYLAEWINHICFGHRLNNLFEWLHKYLETLLFPFNLELDLKQVIIHVCIEVYQVTIRISMQWHDSVRFRRRENPWKILEGYWEGFRFDEIYPIAYPEK